MSLQLNDAYMFVLWAGGLALQINLLFLSLPMVTGQVKPNQFTPGPSHPIFGQ